MVKSLSTSLLVALLLGSTACARTMRDDGSPGDTTGGGATGLKPLGESALFVRQVNALSASNGCVADSSTTGPVVLSGALDVALSLSYQADLLVGFQPVGNVPNAPAGVSFQDVVVRVEDASGTVLWGPVTVPSAGFADSAPDHVTYGLTQTTLLGAELGARLAAELQAQPGLVRHLTSVARVSGQTVGGSAVQSDEFRFPLTVCYGCLITFPREANDLKLSKQPNCLLSPATGAPVPKPCRVGQDDEVDCRVCKEYFPNSALCEP